MRAIDGFSRILLEDYAEQLSGEAKGYLNTVRDNARQMGRLVDDLLAFSRLGRQPIKKQTVDPSDAVRKSLEELRDEREGRQVEIVIGDLPPCEAEPALLKQVWLNLLANALKYTRREGGGEDRGRLPGRRRSAGRAGLFRPGQRRGVRHAVCP